MSKIEIVSNGITDLNTDAVVNAANSGLMAGGGVCGVIFKAAGYRELQDACDKIGGCPTGSAVITPAFKLNAKYIIHAVGPIWNGGNRGEPEQLYGAYAKSLELAKENGCKSIGFPLISAGIFGYPADKAFEVAIKACRDFIEGHPDYDILIRFGVPEEKKRDIGNRILEKEFSKMEKEDNKMGLIKPTASQIIGFHLPEEKNGYLSNWYMAPFSYARQKYCCLEQYMMFQKVAIGRRYDLAGEIMGTDNPSEMQKLAGSKYYPEYVSQGVDKVWESIRKQVVKQGIRAKFAQNELLFKQLLSTGTAMLAECSASDSIWGIGINIKSDEWKDVGNWKGSNTLGRVLMEVREELKTDLLIEGKVEYVDYCDAEPIPEWNMTAAELKRIPQYYQAIHAYSEQLPYGLERPAFYNGCSLNEWEIAMRENMGGGLPVAMFYEMKQEVYETARRLGR